MHDPFAANLLMWVLSRGVAVAGTFVSLVDPLKEAAGSPRGKVDRLYCSLVKAPTFTLIFCVAPKFTLSSVYHGASCVTDESCYVQTCS